VTRDLITGVQLVQVLLNKLFGVTIWIFIVVKILLHFAFASSVTASEGNFDGWNQNLGHMWGNHVHQKGDA